MVQLMPMAGREVSLTVIISDFRGLNGSPGTDRGTLAEYP